MDGKLKKKSLPLQFLSKLLAKVIQKEVFTIKDH